MDTVLIRNATLVRPEGLETGSLFLQNGKISDQSEPTMDADRIIEGDGLYVLPGMIDSHTHLRGGVLRFRESFYSGTRAAATAGITTLLEMPTCMTPPATPENFALRAREVREQACIDMGLYAGAGIDNLDQISLLADAGAIGFKTFRMPPVPGREKEFYGLCAVSQTDLERVMEQVVKTGLTLTIHAENPEIIQKNTDQIRAMGQNRVSDFCLSRPEEAEIVATAECIQAAEKTGCRTIIAHVSTSRAVRLIAQAQARGVAIYAECCPQYLTFDSACVDHLGPFARMKPPFRARDTVNELVDCCTDGLFSITGSDHAPYTFDEKNQGKADIWQAPDGLPGLELSLLLLLRLVEAGKLSWEQLAKMTAEHTARIFGLAQKGQLTVGRDADLVLVRQLSSQHPIRCAELFCKQAETALLYEGLPVSHRIEMTIARGKIVYENHTPCVNAGQGKLLHPERLKGV